ncbi:MAG: PQQ-binding-like beta-propeller repeat protein [Acidimicrobiales bacterium]|nr:PQQ-binding-like beta-propeller repeat protein [Acidimicrobiales bacterium]
MPEVIIDAETLEREWKMTRVRMVGNGRIVAGVIAVVLLVAAGCSGDDDASPVPDDDTDENVESGDAVAPVRYQDVWVYERISTVDLDGEVIDLTPSILETADGLGDPIELAGDTEFLEWPALEPHLIDGDGTTRDDVDAVAGIARSGDREAIMVVGTPASDDTPPIDDDDQVRIDLTAIEDQLQPGDPLVMQYTFAHTFGPDADDAPDSGVELFLHRAEQQRIRYAASPDGGVALATDLGQAYAGSVLGGTPAKAQPMMDGFRDGIENCAGDIGIDCVGDYFEDFDEGAETSWNAVMDQVCTGDDCGDGDGGGDNGGGDNGGGDGGGGDDGGGDNGGGDDADASGDDGGGDGKKGGFCSTYPHCDRDDPEPGDPGFCTAFPDQCSGDPDNATPDPDGGSTDGDPHVHTFDGRHYIIQSVGEFVLAETDDWVTQVRYVSRDDRRRYSLADVVATRIGGHTVVFDPNPEDEDGDPLPATATLDGELVDVVRNGPEVEIDGLVFGHRTGYLWVALPEVGSVGVGTTGFPRADVVVLDPDLEFQGLLGDRDGDKANDLRLGPDGAVLEDPSQDEIHGAFADAWRVTDETSLLPYGPGESTTDYTDLDHPEQPIARSVADSGREAQAETLCRIAQVSEASMAACIIDYAVTGDVSWVTGSAISDRFRGFVRGEPEVGAPSSDADADADSGAGADGSTTVRTNDTKPIGGTPPGVPDGDVLYQFVEDTTTERTALLAIDIDSGEERWRLDGIEWRCGVGILGDGRLAVVQSADKSQDRAAAFAVIDAEAGDITASTEWDGAPSTYCTPMVVIGDAVVVASRLGDLFAFSTDGDPTLAWETDQPLQLTGVAVTDAGRLLVQRRHDGGAYVSALELVDPADGAVLDATMIPGRIGSGSLVVVGDLVVTVGGATDEPGHVGTVVGVDVAGDSLERRWERAYFEADAAAGPDETAGGPLGVFTTDGDLLVGYAGPELLALDVDTGEERWRVDPDGFRNTKVPPTVVDGVIYDTVFGGAPLVAFSGEDGSLLQEWSDDAVFGDGGETLGRGVFGPIIGDRIVVEGTGPDDELVVAVVQRP